MSKPFHYWTRFTLAVTLSVTLVVSPAWAGRIFKHRAKHRAAAECCFELPADCCTPSPSWSTDGCAVAPVDQCGCDGEVISTVPSVEHAPAVPKAEESIEAKKPEITETTPAPSLAPAPTPAPEHNVEPAVPSTEAPKVIESEPSAPSTPFTEPEAPAAPVEQPAPVVVDETPAPQPEPAPELAPPTDLSNPPAEAPVTPLQDNLAVPPTEPASPATEDIFSTPPAQEVTPQPEAKPADDIFGAPEQTQPAPAPAAGDELFGVPTTPPTETTPAPASGTDDLFSTPTEPAAPAATEPPASAPTDGLFDTPAAPSETTPAPATDRSVEDVFGAPEVDTTKPAEEPANPAADSLFDAPAEAPAPAATEGAAGLFDAPAEPAAEPEKVDSSASGLDELFGNPVSKPDATTPEAPAASSSEDKKADSEFDKLFDSSDLRNPSSGFSGAEQRVWVDNTGNFTTVGRLVTIYPSEIKLLKENGKTTTVPFRRLSEGDLTYIKGVYAAMSKDKSKELLVQHERGKQVQSGVTR